LDKEKIFDVCVIGAGPAGLIAAITSASNNAKILLLESQKTPGQKLLLTGGGRCNFTHLDEIDTLLKKYGRNGKFLSYAIHKFPPNKVIEYFENLGIKTKIEKDGCVFPESDNAIEILKALIREIKKNQVILILNSRVISIEKDEHFFKISTSNQIFLSKKIIIATGGLSYPLTGSNGDGYNFAKSFGHIINTPIPSLVPLVVKEKYINTLAGLSLEKIKIKVFALNKSYERTGDILFMHNGLSGPVILDLSKEISKELNINKNSVKIIIDLIQNYDEDSLEKYFLNQIKKSLNKKIISSVNNLIPQSLAKILFQVNNLDPNKNINQITKIDRKKLIHGLKNFTLTIIKTLPIKAAMITQGGISIQEINDRTMESKLTSGLFFAGEVIDVDGICGGYNLQMCWSTGRLAGLSAVMTL
jgi:hypothetical protein